MAFEYVEIEDANGDPKKVGADSKTIGLDTVYFQGMAVDVGGDGQTPVMWTAAAGADATANPTAPPVSGFQFGFNGTTWDRIRTATADALASTGLKALGNMVFNGSTWDRLRSATADALASTGLLAAANMFYNGSTWDRARGDTTNGLDVDVTRVSGTVTVDSELPAAGALADAASNPTTPTVGAGGLGYNGSTWDRLRTATADALASTGLLAAASMFYNGSTWDRFRGDTTNGLDVDVTRVIPGTSATHLGKAEDGASADGDTGVGMLAVRKATPANTSGTDGDYEFLQMSAGRLWTSSTIDAALPVGSNAIGKLAANSGVDIGDVDVTSISAGENHLGEVGGGGTLLDVTLTLDTSAYADGDVFFVAATLTNAVRVVGGRAILQSVMVIDEDDQGQTFDLFFLDTSNSLGTINAAPSISDANSRTILGRVRIDSGEYIDLGGMKMASKYGIGLFLKSTGATRDLYIGGIIRGAATYTASGVRLRLGLLWD